MCIICVELIKQRMTLDEASKNLGELVNDRKAKLDLLQHRARLKEAIDLMDKEYIGQELDRGDLYEDNLTITIPK